MAAGPRPLIGLAAGIAAGLVAAAAMAAFQARAAALLPEDDDTPDVPEPSAGPYIVGAVIGGIYGVISEYRPEASDGFIGTYGIAAAALADPAGALGLDGDGDLAEPSPVGVASDLVFGAVLAGVRWLLAGRR
jgi:hypothetical protein